MFYFSFAAKLSPYLFKKRNLQLNYYKICIGTLASCGA